MRKIRVIIYDRDLHNVERQIVRVIETELKYTRTGELDANNKNIAQLVLMNAGRVTLDTI
jgi:hypothetical protein